VDKTYCNRCRVEVRYRHYHYAVSKDLQFFDEYLWPQGALCDDCESDFRVFLSGVVVPAKQDVPYTRRERKLVQKLASHCAKYGEGE
jgi:hypothetical protein